MNGTGKKIGKICALFVLVLMTPALAAAAGAAPVLRMAAATSADNTGLLYYLAPIFLADEGIELQWVSVGTGRALEYGRNGDVDIVLTHDPVAEKSFIDEEFGVEPREVMYNDFVLIGPASDPAEIKGLSVNEAFAVIASKSVPFVSRADQSGTHMAEMRVWSAAGLDDPDGETWYIRTGQGMLDTINVAGESQCYVFTDRSTFIAFETNYRGNPPLVILAEGGETLKNQYSVIPVNPAKHDNVNFELARAFSEWLASPKAQEDIANFRLEEKQLFFPNAD